MRLLTKLLIADRELLNEEREAARPLFGNQQSAISNSRLFISKQPSAISNPLRRGWSLVEVVVALTVVSVLITFAAPSFRRTMEQSRADIAAANLRAIWSAQRLYWLDYRTYTNDLTELEALGLLDPTLGSATNYLYAITAADSASFTATATRTGSSVWSGVLSIDETGAVTGVISASAQPNIVPGFQ
jgi:type IV pilus assembly protein PilE